MDPPLKIKIEEQLVNLNGSDDDNIIKKILFSYNFATSASVNIDKLVDSFNKDDLLKAVTYINEHYKTVIL